MMHCKCRTKEWLHAMAGNSTIRGHGYCVAISFRSFSSVTSGLSIIFRGTIILPLLWTISRVIFRIRAREHDHFYVPCTCGGGRWLCISVCGSLLTNVESGCLISAAVTLGLL